MIEHTRRSPAPEPVLPPEPDVPAGPMETVWVRDVDFVYGFNDADTVTLTPEDTLVVGDEVFYIELVKANETIEITRSRVRMWSVRYREMTRELRSFDPADVSIPE